MAMHFQEGQTRQHRPRFLERGRCHHFGDATRYRHRETATTGEDMAGKKNKLPTKTLNLRLLRTGRSVDDAFTSRFRSGPERLAELPWPTVENARRFVGQIYSTTPSWVDFVNFGVEDDETELISGGAGAVLFIPTNGRMLAVCFGYAHLALDDGAFEAQFGLRVTLNAVPRSGLRSLDLATPDATTFQRRVQASRDSDIGYFGVDVLRDLAQVAGGTPSNLDFAKFLAGRDSLSITCQVAPETLQKKCQQVLEMYDSDGYQQEFGWIDNLQAVRSSDLIDALDEQLASSIRSAMQGNDAGTLHLAPPEIKDYQSGTDLRYNGLGSERGAVFTSLAIEDYAAELDARGFDGNIETVKKHHQVSARGPDDTWSEKWKVYDCFVFETRHVIEDREGVFVLFAGKWYQVEQRFKESVEAYFDRIPRVDLIGPTDCANEEALIAYLDENRADLLKLDRNLIGLEGLRHDRVEPCDFLSKGKQFVHLKDGHSSGPISHLWSQGFVSADLFANDAAFRKELRRRVKALDQEFAELLPRAHERPNRESYTVVYGIMRKPRADGTLDLPFFSKVSFQAAAEQIRRLNIPVALELIEKQQQQVD